MINIKYAQDTNTPTVQCYGWVTSCGIHFIDNDITAVTSFWEPNGIIEVHQLDKHYDTLAEVIEYVGFCTPEEVIRILNSSDEFIVEA